MDYKQMVEKFQCLGCVAGFDTDCGSYKQHDDPSCGRCVNHVLGTMIGLGNLIALGLPKAFCKPSINWDATPPQQRVKMSIRLWLRGTSPKWDHLNVPVWALEEDDYLFVRTFSPRIDMTYVDVIEGGRREDVPKAIDVSTFLDEID